MQAGEPVRAVSGADFALLPELYRLLDALGGEHVQDVTKQVLAVKAKLKHSEELLNSLPGVELSRQQQAEVLKSKMEEFNRKKELLAKYRNLDVFQNLQKVPEGDGVRSMDQS
eukprot:comp18366_c1_seq1/m.19518 comp18366_c1_seq1/g.19518  ORF comp18366_c1_seq1/g.19518 comp18366_c1_seq1/m.19518 type:complete len:113 (-) comp18366_c1_seq1:48-386(-)